LKFLPVDWILLFKRSCISRKTSTAYVRMARSALPKLFWARPKSEFGEHASNNVWNNNDCMSDFGSKLLISFLMLAIYSFLKYLSSTQTSSGEISVRHGDVRGCGRIPNAGKIGHCSGKNFQHLGKVYSYIHI